MPSMILPQGPSIDELTEEDLADNPYDEYCGWNEDIEKPKSELSLRDGLVAIWIPISKGWHHISASWID